MWLGRLSRWDQSIISKGILKFESFEMAHLRIAHDLVHILMHNGLRVLFGLNFILILFMNLML